MAKVEHFEDLEVWQLGREICMEVEELFKSTALGKRYKLRDQMDILFVLFPLMKVMHSSPGGRRMQANLVFIFLFTRYGKKV